MVQQWQSAVAPYHRRRAFCQIIVNGKDVTDALDPHLISVQVILRDTGPDMANIELDDRDGSLPIPPNKSSVKVLLGWAGSGPTLPLSEHVASVYKTYVPEQYVDGSPLKELPWEASGMQMVFAGTVQSVESGFSRSGGGRRLWIECKSQLEGDHKSPSLTTVGEGVPDGGGGQEVSLKDFMSQAMQKGGLTLQATGIDDIKRKFWIQDNESAAQLGQRIAAELGLSFKIIGGRAFLTPIGEQPDGNMAPTVEALWGSNLISWRIKPFTSRPQWAKANQRFFDIWNGLWKDVNKGIGGTKLPFGGINATAMLPGPAPNSQAGQQYNSGMQADSEAGRGTGWVIINGEPAAQANGAVVISGARPGVDGRYKISEAEHNYTRGGGYTTRCQLKDPNLSSSDYEKMGGWLSLEQRGELEIDRQLREFPFFLWDNGDVGAPDDGQ